MTVRPAVAADKMAVVRMLRDAHRAGGLPFPFSAPHAAALFDMQLAMQDRLLLVLEADDGPCGVLMASAQDHPFASIRYAAEVAWWIDPSARGSIGAMRMLAAYEEWARGAGCALIQMAALTAAPRAGALYERRGYRSVETHFLKSLAAL